MLVMTTIFISKMEGLPPTSTTKMIDFWLIQCQLVPFAQVVLLTVKEHLREGPQGIWGNDDIKDPPPRQNTVEGETIPKEAWTITEIKSSKAGSLTMLSMLGKVLIRFLISYRNDFFVEKRVLPLSVLFASIVYFAIAARFYFEL